MKGKRVQSICVIFFLVLAATVTQAGAGIVTVDKNGGGNYSSIQEAVDNAQNGDVILVNPGIYQENVVVDKELTILSNSVSSENQLNRAYVIGVIPEGQVFSVNASNVTVSGFYISGGYSATADPDDIGILLAGVKNCSLSENTLVLNNIGVGLYNSQGNYIGNNSMIGPGSGIVLVGSTENILSNNLAVTDGNSEGIGILLNSSTNNTLVNNTARSDLIGIYLDVSEGNSLLYNIASSNADGIGIGLNSSNSNFVMNNIAKANKLGIMLDTSDRNTIADNLVSKNDIGIFGDMAGLNTLSNNSLYLNGIGMGLSGSSSNNTIYKNRFINLINAMDKGTNLWNSSSEGNAWNNYTGADADGNGIGDTPYVVNETTGSIDYFPTSVDNFSAISSEIENW
ncbi:right-handed parallel beta-helix repeat-containing protein [Methanosarcina sp.]|uniref:right-handed parallel beta-helix repeat-containing protein n=1 Tax=Methanosarcina sp. TaxID=2213 RepID=UPI003C77E21C